MRTTLFALLAGLLAVTSAVSAKDKKAKPVPKDPQDEISVVGHIPLTDGPVVRFLATPHYSSYYLYAEHIGGKTVTLIDVTNIAAPAVLSNVSYPSTGGSSLFAVTGTAALVTASAANVTPDPPTQSIRIMDFSDPKNPRVAREFTGVTAVTRDDRRGLIFIAVGEGIWVLRQKLAEDPQIEKDYENYIRYNR